ncbi:MAG TPA: DUF397 domain-containing protein [Streptosporangiaceae bacterium]|nr:DUF397 domain-containing protein [Streptosporangiaceae bacterium]
MVLTGTWRKSSYSASMGDCLEVAPAGNAVLVRDSRDKGGPVLLVAAAPWRAFLAAVKAAPVE